MRTIYKYEVPFKGRFKLSLPKESVILSFQNQNGVLYIWAIVETAHIEEERTFRLFATGHPLGNIPKGAGIHYIGTVQQSQMPALVWHLFEEVKK